MSTEVPLRGDGTGVVMSSKVFEQQDIVLASGSGYQSGGSALWVNSSAGMMLSCMLGKR